MKKKDELFFINEFFQSRMDNIQSRAYAQYGWETDKEASERYKIIFQDLFNLLWDGREVVISHLTKKQINLWDKKLNKLESLKTITKDKDLLIYIETLIKVQQMYFTIGEKRNFKINNLKNKSHLSLVINNPSTWYDKTVARIKKNNSPQKSKIYS